MAKLIKKPTPSVVDRACASNCYLLPHVSFTAAKQRLQPSSTSRRHEYCRVVQQVQARHPQEPAPTAQQQGRRCVAVVVQCHEPAREEGRRQARRRRRPRRRTGRRAALEPGFGGGALVAVAVAVAAAWPVALARRRAPPCRRCTAFGPSDVLAVRDGGGGGSSRLQEDRPEAAEAPGPGQAQERSHYGLVRWRCRAGRGEAAGAGRGAEEDGAGRARDGGRVHAAW